MSVYQLKPRFQQLLLPFMVQLRRWGILPNHLTWAGLYSSLLGGSLLIILPRTSWIIAPILLLRMCLNALDGMMARRYKLESQKGAILNEMGDLIADLGIYLPFFYLAGAPPLILIGVGTAIAATEFSGVLNWAVRGKRTYAGPMGKSDRALLIGLFALLMSVHPPAREWISMLGFLMIGAMCVSIYNRLTPLS